MERMSIEEIISSDEDFEIKKYQILSAMKFHSDRFRKNLLYPSLTELVNSAVKLERMTQKEYFLDMHDDMQVFTDGLETGDQEVEEEYDENAELSKWAVYQINTILDEGIALFEFAENDIQIYKVGNPTSIDAGCDTGYFIIPNLEEKQANIYRFEKVVYNNTAIPVTTIKTKHLISFSEEELRTNSSKPAINILMDYINDKGSVVYFCSTEIELPYEETVLPVAKKNLLKLMAE